MTESEDGNETAPEGSVFQCLACGKRSRDLYGDQALDHGWDESCMMNAALMTEAEANSNHPMRDLS